MAYHIYEQDHINTKECKLVINNRTEDIALHSWFIDISSSSMCILFRCVNSKLPVYDQIYMFDTDKCTLCDLNARGEEYHYILICPFFK